MIVSMQPIQREQFNLDEDGDGNFEEALIEKRGGPKGRGGRRRSQRRRGHGRGNGNHGKATTAASINRSRGGKRRRGRKNGHVSSSQIARKRPRSPPLTIRRISYNPKQGTRFQEPPTKRRAKETNNVCTSARLNTLLG